MKQKIKTAIFNNYKGTLLASLLITMCVAAFFLNVKVGQNAEVAKEYFKKGSALSKLGKHEEALKQYDLSLKYNPKSNTAYHNKGSTFYSLGQLWMRVQ
jgi:tetratricopeptide (TPR) repeat protein